MGAGQAQGPRLPPLSQPEGRRLPSGLGGTQAAHLLVPAVGRALTACACACSPPYHCRGEEDVEIDDEDEDDDEVEKAVLLIRRTVADERPLEGKQTTITISIYNAGKA